MNIFFEIPLRPKKDAAETEELYQEVWELITSNIHKLATDPGSKDIVVRFLLDTKSYGFGESNSNQLKFIEEEYSTVVTEVCKHWFEMVSVLVHRQLTTIATAHGYSLKKPDHKAIDITSTPRQMPFWSYRNQLIGIVRSESPKLKSVENEIDFNILSDEDKSIVLDIVKTGLCTCSVCEAIRKGVKPLRKKKAPSTVMPNEPVELEEFTSLSKAMRSPERVGSLYLGDQPIESLPDDIDRLVYLTSLSAGNTQITKLPPSLFSIPGLKSITLNETRLQSLPDEIRNGKAINTLILDRTPIRQLPDSISELANLEFLNLSMTSLEKIPETLLQLSKLKSLDLGYCSDLRQALPNLGALTTLEQLSLTEVPASKDAIDFSTLLSLKELSLRNAQFSTLPESMRHLVSLRQLSLNRNPLSELPDWLSNLTNLEDLELWGCNLKSIPKALNTLSHLSILSLAENPIETLNHIGGFKALNYLTIKGCTAIDHLPDEIGELTKLTKLFLDNTSITTLPDAIGKLSKLEHMSLSNTKLTALPASIGNLTALTSIYLDDNSITELPTSMANLVKLERIIIRKTKITKIPNWLLQLPALRQIDVSSNQLDAGEAAKVNKAKRDIRLSVG